MNIEQLERLRTEIAVMRTILEADREGCFNIDKALNELGDLINEELKNQIWVRYLEAEGNV